MLAIIIGLLVGVGSGSVCLGIAAALISMQISVKA